MSKPEAPSQAEPREEPCVWEQRDPEEREILMDPDTGDGSCREPPGRGGVGEKPPSQPEFWGGGLLLVVRGAGSAAFEVWRSRTRSFGARKPTMEVRLLG